MARGVDVENWCTRRAGYLRNNVDQSIGWLRLSSIALRSPFCALFVVLPAYRNVCRKMSIKGSVSRYLFWVKVKGVCLAFKAKVDFRFVYLSNFSVVIEDSRYLGGVRQIQSSLVFMKHLR